MQFQNIFLATLATTSISAWPLGNGCHWYLIAIVCKGPAQSGTPAPVPAPPPAPPCTTCAAPPCPAACTPFIPAAQRTIGATACPAPQYALFGSTGNFQCCGPANDPLTGMAAC
ncbi:hypothetical protein HYFRA_00008075 [Hymenoscyphus fraxineus]|uniref:Uncharacterized protein n=1 Tax=Hymenoscyphus fraxineus TaxID=746836 RepID=A0A9N9KNW9_9HELO|nr:hypothetical protein HYFRA_00008075 [Hymenoscyphus fraxineus]